jgi:hypothetical protein
MNNLKRLINDFLLKKGSELSEKDKETIIKAADILENYGVI